MLLMSALMLVSCDLLGEGNKTGDENQTGGDDVSLDAGFYMTIDKNVIQSNGEDSVTLMATLDGNDVTAETIFYLVSGKDLKPMAGNIFSTSTEGEYSFRASYMTFSTKDPVSVKAIDTVIPDAAVDSDPSNTSFVHRSFLNQYTGTGCGYCPGMKRAIEEAFKDEQTKNMAVLAAVHSYGTGDPAYIAAPRASGYPYLEIDMSAGFSYEMDPTAKGGVLKAALLERTSVPAKVGISANPSLSDNLLVVRVAVKAAEAGDYSLGVWFMQDNVFGQQTDYLGIADNSYNYHDNCVRVADSRNQNNYAGFPLGTLAKGQVVERTFVCKVEKDDWKLKNLTDLHFAAFVTERTKKGFNVLNVVDCKYNEPTPFEYK